MPYNPAMHNRHSICLPGYDYRQVGAYFVTINTYKKEYLFGEIVGGVVKLSPIGEIVQEQWLVPTPLWMPGWWTGQGKARARTSRCPNCDFMHWLPMMIVFAHRI